MLKILTVLIVCFTISTWGKPMNGPLNQRFEIDGHSAEDGHSLEASSEIDGHSFENDGHSLEKREARAEKDGHSVEEKAKDGHSVEEKAKDGHSVEAKPERVQAAQQPDANQAAGMAFMADGNAAFKAFEANAGEAKRKTVEVEDIVKKNIEEQSQVQIKSSR